MTKLTKTEIKAIFRAMSLITTLGITIVVCVGMGVFVGWWLDRWLNTTPWLILVFSLLGVVAAFKTMIEMLRRVEETDKDKSDIDKDDIDNDDIDKDDIININNQYKRYKSE